MLASDPIYDHSAMRHGDAFGHRFKASIAQPVDLSAWHTLQELGIFRLSVLAGEMKRKVWLRTFTPVMVCSILGMWQPTHSLPALPAL